MSTARRVRRRLRQLGFGRLLVAVPCVFLSIYCWGFVPLSFTVLSIVLYLPLLDVPVVIFRDRDFQACIPVTQVMTRFSHLLHQGWRGKTSPFICGW